jgi:hypothetical protein
MITGYTSVDSAVSAVPKGPYDYEAKPFALGYVEVVLRRIKDRMALEEENRELASDELVLHKKDRCSRHARSVDCDVLTTVGASKDVDVDDCRQLASELAQAADVSALASQIATINDTVPYRRIGRHADPAEAESRCACCASAAMASGSASSRRRRPCALAGNRNGCRKPSKLLPHERSRLA